MKSEQKKLIRSRAPLRLGLAGGGTDVSPYSDLFGGSILNVTIDMYASATIKPLDNGKIILNAVDRGTRLEFESDSELPIDGNLDLAKGVYNHIVKAYNLKPLSFELTTHVDAPPGSGLGSSSTLVVAILGAFAEWQNLPLGEYDIAHLAFEIERIDLGLSGGKQDQYAATFGGVNFMEFKQDDQVIVNPLRIRNKYLHELESTLILYYTQTSRLSSKIIDEQTTNVKKKNNQSIEAMHKLKEQAVKMKEALLRGKLDEIGKILDFGWKYKKQMAAGISNPLINDIYETGMAAGATGGKISGAGGGGFIVFYAPETNRYAVIESLKKFGGQSMRYRFTKNGLTTWSI